MIVNFGEIINEVIRGLGLDIETIETRVLDSIKLRINEAQDVVYYDSDWEWRKRTFYMTTTAPYSTGTISITQNTRTVTGVGTVFTDSMKMGYVIINSKIYKIESVASTTSLKIVAPFDQSTVSTLSYQIVFPDYVLNHEISSVTRVKYNDTDISPKHISRLLLSPSVTSLPAECAFSDRTAKNYYTTGSLTLTSNSASIVGVGTSWSSEMEGMTFRVDEFSKAYTISSVNSATSITLTTEYEGASGTGKTYKINPIGSQLITFRNSPDTYYLLEIEALTHSTKLINSNDISLVPNHMPLIHTAIWLALADLENKNPVRIQQARADAERTMKQLRSSYRILTNIQWKSERETRVRKQFNPLER